MSRTLGLVLAAGACLAGSEIALAQYTIVTNQPGAFIPNVDVPANFRAIDSGGTTDDGAASLTIPPAYGNNILPAGTAYAITNGRLLVTNNTIFNNVAITPTSVEGYYPFWDDLLMTVGSAGYPTATFGTGTEGVYAAEIGGVFVVQWDCRPFNLDNSGFATPSGGGYQFRMQVQIRPTPGPAGGVVAQYVYQNMGTITGQSATIGLVQLFPAGTFTMYSQDTVGAINDTTVLTIVAPPTAPACYANCDNSSVAPVLNVADFTCFLQKFAAADPTANCDGSTTPPALNVADFTCFLQKFAAGCP